MSEPSAAAVRATVERGDAEAIMRDVRQLSEFQLLVLHKQVSREAQRVYARMYRGNYETGVAISKAALRQREAVSPDRERSA